MADDSENVNRAVTLLREAADVLAQTNINVNTSNSQSTSTTTPNTRPFSLVWQEALGLYGIFGHLYRVRTNGFSRSSKTSKRWRLAHAHIL